MGGVQTLCRVELSEEGLNLTFCGGRLELVRARVDFEKNEMPGKREADSAAIFGRVQERWANPVDIKKGRESNYNKEQTIVKEERSQKRKSYSEKGGLIFEYERKGLVENEKGENKNDT